VKRADSTLQERSRTGEVSVIGDLFERYQREIFRYFYYRIGDTHTAEDLTSEVFLRAMEALPEIRLDQESYQAWLFRIARNLSIDYYRKAKCRQDQML